MDEICFIGLSLVKLEAMSCMLWASSAAIRYDNTIYKGHDVNMNAMEKEYHCSNLM